MSEPVFSLDEGSLGRSEFVGQGPRTIVVGIDDSPSALRAMAYAAGLARRNSAVLVLVHVHYGSGPLGLLAAHIPALAGIDENDSKVVPFTLVARALGCKYDIKVAIVLRHGNPAREIARLAREVQADAIVVGCPRTWFRRFAESVSSRLSRVGTWPITIVP